jgi:NAD(P)-dependent dehydrogenase (short-subunit alcohol dehydrogenase family)
MSAAAGGRLAGRVALVTGAGGGIGRAIALRLGAEGAAVALMDLAAARDTLGQTEAAVRESGARCASAVGDVADPGSVAQALAALQAALGPIDCLVNNAGLTGHIAALTRMSAAGWERELAVNLSGPFHLTQALLPGMVERRWGRIVNISSVAALGGLYYQAGYSASKAGLLGLTRTVVLEHARHGITCNAVLPGLIGTPAVLGMPPAVLNDAVALTPARRTGEPAEIASVVAFLCSPEAAFVNGAEIPVDGGGHLSPVVLGSGRELRERQAAQRGEGQLIATVPAACTVTERPTDAA